MDIDDIISFHADSVSEFAVNFHAVIDDYIAACEQTGADDGATYSTDSSCHRTHCSCLLVPSLNHAMTSCLCKELLDVLVAHGLLPEWTNHEVIEQENQKEQEATCCCDDERT